MHLKQSTLLLAAFCWSGIAFPANALTYRLSILDGLEGGVAINAAGCVVGLNAGSSGASIYSHGAYTDLGTLGGWVHPFGMNDLGDVVGEADAIVGEFSGHYAYGSRAFLYSNGQITDLGMLPNGLYGSWASAINNGGVVVGVSSVLWDPDDAYARHAFTYSEGVMRPLGWSYYYGGIYPQAINDKGEVVGYYQNYNSAPRNAVLFFSDGTQVELGPGTAYDINEKGQIIGETLGAAWLYENGNRLDLGSFTPLSINNNGQIVGMKGSTPVLYDDGNLYELNSCLEGVTDWSIVSVRAINDSGVIVGSAKTSTPTWPFYSTRAFILTPDVPEPGTLILFASASFVAMRWRHSNRGEITYGTYGSGSAAPGRSSACSGR